MLVAVAVPADLLVTSLGPSALAVLAAAALVAGIHYAVMTGAAHPIKMRSSEEAT